MRSQWVVQLENEKTKGSQSATAYMLYCLQKANQSCKKVSMNKGIV